MRHYHLRQTAATIVLTKRFPPSTSTPPIPRTHPVEQAVVYSTLPQEYSTLTFEGEVVADGGGVEERSEVMYCIEGRTYIYYKGA